MLIYSNRTVNYFIKAISRCRMCPSNSLNLAAPLTNIHTGAYSELLMPDNCVHLHLKRLHPHEVAAVIALCIFMTILGCQN